MSLMNQLLSKPKIITSGRQSELNNLIGNLKTFTRKYFFNQTGYVRHFETVVKIMSFESILRRGFAVISQNGKIIKSAENIETGSDITITMEDYKLDSKVIKKNKING